MFRSLSFAFLMGVTALSAQAKDDVLDVVSPFELKGKDPISSGSIFLKMDVLETLIDAKADGTLIPGLASGWSVSDENLTWTFTLRDNVRFHDGEVMNGDTVAQSLNWSKNNGGLLARTPVKSITGEANTVTIELLEPFSMLPAMLVEYRSAIISPKSIGQDGNIIDVVGTGPYQVTAFSPPIKMTVQGFNDYWGKAAAINKAAYHGISRAETRALMAESGDADLTLSLDPASFTR
ncbi:ABC transporter substrate-binding protein [Veronia nyctiphanis]|uniref:ABC transporter substrate-binding protein n=1 Tax=Veronia nyctiphanis TaxID=1278244 RepID=UPI00191C5BEB|nr:ABC transporter substrate-binding protein [Veronia nyctiphanis]